MADRSTKIKADILDSIESQINPATEETLQEVSNNQDIQTALITALNALVTTLTESSEDQKQSLYVLKQLPKILEILQNVDTSYRLFVNVAAGTINTVTTLNQYGGQSIYFDQTEVRRTTFNTGIRNNLSFS